MSQSPEAKNVPTEKFSGKLRDLFEQMMDEYPIVQPGLVKMYELVALRANQELDRDKPNPYAILRRLQAYLGGLPLMADNRMEPGDAHPPSSEIRLKLLKGAAGILLAHSRVGLEWDRVSTEPFTLREIHRPEAQPLSAKLLTLAAAVRNKLKTWLPEKQVRQAVEQSTAPEPPQVVEKLEKARLELVNTYKLSGLNLPGEISTEQGLKDVYKSGKRYPEVISEMNTEFYRNILENHIPKVKRVLEALTPEEKKLLEGISISVSESDNDIDRVMKKFIHLDVTKSDAELVAHVQKGLRRYIKPKPQSVVTDNLRAERAHLTNREDPREHHSKNKADHVAIKFGLRGIALHYNAANQNRQMEMGLNKLEQALKELKSNNERAVLDYLAGFSITLYVGTEPEAFDNVINVHAESPKPRMMADFRNLQKESLSDVYSAGNLKQEWNFRHLLRTDLEPGQGRLSSEHVQKLRDVMRSVDPKYHRMLKEVNLGMHVVMHSETMMDIRQTKVCQLDITKEAGWLVDFFNRKCEEVFQPIPEEPKKEITAPIDQIQINREHFEEEVQKLVSAYGLKRIDLDEEIFDYKFPGLIDGALSRLRSALEQLKAANGGLLNALRGFAITLSNRPTGMYPAAEGQMSVLINYKEIPDEIVSGLKVALSMIVKEQVRAAREVLKQQVKRRLADIQDRYRIKIEFAASAQKDPKWMLGEGIPVLEKMFDELPEPHLKIMDGMTVRIQRRESGSFDAHESKIAIDLEDSGITRFVMGRLETYAFDPHLETTNQFHIAATMGNFDELKHLLEGGFDPNTPNNVGNIASVEAARVKRWAVVKFLAENGADLNKGDVSGVTPLMIAVEQMNGKALKELMALKADPNRVDDMITKRSALDRAKALDDPKISYQFCSFMMTPEERAAYKNELLELGRQRGGNSRITILNKLEFYLGKEEAATYKAELDKQDQNYWSPGLSDFWRDLDGQPATTDPVETSQLRGLGPTGKTESNEGPAVPDATGEYNYKIDPPSGAGEDMMPAPFADLPDTKALEPKPTAPLPRSVALMDQAEGKKTDFSQLPATRQERAGTGVRPPTDDFMIPAPTVQESVEQVGEADIEPLDPKEVTEMAHVGEALEQISKEGTQFTTKADKAFESGRFDTAIKMWEDQMKNGEGDKLEMAKKLGMAYDAIGDAKKAHGYFELAFQNNPQDQDALWKLSHHFYRNQNLPLACQHLQQLIALNPNHDRARAILGGILGAMNQNQAAKRELEFAVQLSPRLLDARHNLAVILFRMAKKSQDPGERSRLAGLASAQVQNALHIKGNYGPSIALLGEINAFESRLY